MENNNLDLIPDEPTPEKVNDQETTYAEEISEAVNSESAEVEANAEAEVEANAEAEVEANADAEVEANADAEVEAQADAEVEAEVEAPTNRARAMLSAFYDYAEILALSIIAVIVVFSFCVRLCRVDGHSMQNTLTDGERIIAQDIFYTPKQGDIVVFHLVNDSFRRPLVKRVIATEGQMVEINYTDKTIYVDGVLYEDFHAYIEGGEYLIKTDFNAAYMLYEDGKLYFRATVPEGKLFVLGDNRNNSTDSRSVHVGFVDVDCVLGKAILRLDPFTVFE